MKGIGSTIRLPQNAHLTGRQLSEPLRVSPGGAYFASVRGEALVRGRENGDLEKSLTNYLNN